MEQATARPELWGGIECTVNRVGDDYFDQLERNGHAVRERDLELIADLGIAAIRYPILWERTAHVWNRFDASAFAPSSASYIMEAVLATSPSSIPGSLRN
jgi:hypothetical protein